MSGLPKVHFRHFGFHAVDLDALVAFYCDVLGFVESDGGVASFGNRLVFLTQDVNEHHQLVLFDGRPEGVEFNPINQISFKLESLHDLKTFHGILTEAGVEGIMPVDHGNAWSLYFRDPENNYLELYVDTPWYTHQPCRAPLDLTRSAEEIEEATEQLCRARPDFCTRGEWQDAMRQRIGQQRR